LVATLLALDCGPAVSHGGPVRDHVSLVDNLRARGLRVEPVDRVNITLFSVPGTRLAVSGTPLKLPAEIVSFNYDDTDLGRDGRRVAEQEAQRVSPDGARAVTPTGSVTASYAGPPHLFRRERVIVLYVGDDPEILRALGELVGAQFAGL
jgi:hypothetical protein